MAPSCRKGKMVIIPWNFFFLLFVSFYFPRFSCLVLASHLDPSSNPVIESENDKRTPFRETFPDYEENPDAILLKERQFQLEKLEELVKTLSQLVSRLESRLFQASDKVNEPRLLLDPRDETNDAEKVKNDVELPRQEEVKPVKETGDGAQSGLGLVTKYNTFWLEKFQFVSAVRLGSNPTCVELLPYKDFEGSTKYFAIGDDKGKVYVFMRSGDISVEFDTHSKLEQASPVSAMVSYLSVTKNESIIVSGHENGAITMHRVWEMSNSEESSSLRAERLGRFVIPEGSGSQVNLLQVHHIGRRRYILTTDDNARIAVFSEDGLFHGAVIPSARPIVFLKQRLLFLTETGAGSLDLRTMKLKESECEGLNNSIARNYVFDSTDRSKAFGITSDGDLIHALILGDALNFKCRIRWRRRMDMAEPLSLQAIKGYLLIANWEKIAVYNVSSHHYARAGGPRLLFSSRLDEMVPSFLHRRVANSVYDKKETSIPLIASDNEKIVVVGLGNGYVAMYRSNLAVFKNEFNSILWSSPVLFFVLFLFGAWQFFAKKKEALTSWGPDDPFASTTATDGAPLGSGPGDRAFTGPSRNSEIVEMRRGVGRYPGSYIAGSSSSAEPGFRELNFRGSNAESAGVAKRRDTLFVSSQGGGGDGN